MILYLYPIYSVFPRYTTLLPKAKPSTCTMNSSVFHLTKVFVPAIIPLFLMHLQVFLQHKNMLNTFHLKTKNSSLNPSFPSSFSTISLFLCTEKLHKSSVYFFCLHFLTPNLSLTYFYNNTKIALMSLVIPSC